MTAAALNRLTGGGITCSNLFAGWPKDRLATVHNDEVATTNDVCERYFRLGRAEIDVIATLRFARRFRGGATAAAPAPVPAGAAVATGLLARLQGDSAPQRARLTPEIERFIATFDPQLL